jgi:hypothetical protein
VSCVGGHLQLLTSKFFTVDTYGLVHIVDAVSNEQLLVTAAEAFIDTEVG